MSLHIGTLAQTSDRICHAGAAGAADWKVDSGAWAFARLSAFGDAQQNLRSSWRWSMRTLFRSISRSRVCVPRAGPREPAGSTRYSGNPGEGRIRQAVLGAGTPSPGNAASANAYRLGRHRSSSIDRRGSSLPGEAAEVAPDVALDDVEAALGFSFAPSRPHCPVLVRTWGWWTFVWTSPAGARREFERCWVLSRARDNRHRFASHLVMRGGPLRVVQAYLGHSTMMMTMGYSHLAPDVKRDAISVLDGAPAEERKFAPPMLRAV